MADRIQGFFGSEHPFLQARLRPGGGAVGGLQEPDLQDAFRPLLLEGERASGGGGHGPVHRRCAGGHAHSVLFPGIERDRLQPPGGDRTRP